MRLLITELRRFAWRRSFRVFGLLVIAGIITAAVIVFFNSEKSSFTSFHLTSLVDVFEGTSIPLIILGLAFGASFIGAEWHSGTMTTLLTWEPRRVRVMVLKAGAAFIGVGLFAILMQLILGLALWPVAVLRGTTEGVDAGWFLDAAEIVGRGALIAALFATFGLGIASLARNTTTTLVIGFVYFAVAEAILRGLKPNWQPWLVGDNAAAFVTGRPEEIFLGSRSVTASLITVIVYCFGAVAVATAFFRARDVT
jgi:ABC-type transport system involved in multi-copper enzyme maturation permease subunit